jgi:hypothetical protein
VFRDEDLQLIELPQEGLFELGDEPCTSPTTEVQGSQKDDLVERKSVAPLPDATERKLALRRDEAAEPGQEALLDSFKQREEKGGLKLRGSSSEFKAPRLLARQK